MEPINDDNDITQNEINEDEKSIIITIYSRQFVRERFERFTLENSKWVDTFIHFRVQGALIQRIFLNLNSSITPVTLKRNLKKYGGLHSKNYWSCRGHKLIEGNQMWQISLEEPIMQYISRESNSTE